MDYSLLVGVDKQRKELVFGIIDYLRQYTWDKQLETWVKASLVVPRNASPTVISPKEYKKRFRKFMSRYFLTVPDGWNSVWCSVSCGLCWSWWRFIKVSTKLPEQCQSAIFFFCFKADIWEPLLFLWHWTKMYLAFCSVFTTTVHRCSLQLGFPILQFLSKIRGQAGLW